MTHDTAPSRPAHAVAPHHMEEEPPDNDDDLYKDEALYQQLQGRAGNWELTQKPRPFRNPGRLLAGVLYNVIRTVSMGTIFYVGWKYLQTNNQEWMEYALEALVTFLIFQVASYSNGLSTHCPLCHGTPLHSNRSHKNRRADKWLFFGPKASTILSILTRGRFHCMYCGTPFRIKK